MKLNIQLFASDGTITIDTKVDTSGVKKGLTDIEKAADKASGSSLGLGDIIGGNIISGIVLSGLSKVASGIKAIGSEFANLVVQGGLDRTLNIEQAQFKLKGLGHDAKEVSVIMDNALASVKGTAYGLGSAATVAASSVAAGIKPGKELERTLSLIADAAAISGRDLEDMGAIFNKVAAAGKLTGQELNQLTDSGIPVIQLLNETMGTTTEETRKLISQGKVGFQDLADAIEKGMGGAAKTLGGTFQGSIENAKAALARLGQSFLTPFTEALTPAIGTLTDIIDDIAAGSTEEAIKKIDTFIDQVAKSIDGLVDKLEPLLENIIPVIEKLITKIIKKLPELSQKITPVIVKLGVSVIKSLLTILPELISVLLQMETEAERILTEQMPTLIPIVIEGIMKLIQAILDNAPAIIMAGLEMQAALVEGIINGIPVLIDSVPLIIESFIEALIPELPRLVIFAPKLMFALIKGIIKALPSLVLIGPQLVVSLVNGIIKGVPKMVKVGKDLIKGLWQGIKNFDLKKKMSEWADNLVATLKKKFKIGSPSKLLRDEIGIFLAQGIGVGFDNELSNVYDDMQRAINIEQAKLQANVETGKVFNSLAHSTPIAIKLDANVEMDKTKVGRIVTPVVSETLKTGGLR